jgi:hypothetical protein
LISVKNVGITKLSGKITILVFAVIGSFLCFPKNFTPYLTRLFRQITNSLEMMVNYITNIMKHRGGVFG